MAHLSRDLFKKKSCYSRMNELCVECFHHNFRFHVAHEKNKLKSDDCLLKRGYFDLLENHLTLLRVAISTHCHKSGSIY